jgi:competence protein ComEC
VEKLYRYPTQEFIKTIVLGKRSKFYIKKRKEFIRSGTLHFMAISGLHIGFIFIVFFILFRFLRIPYESSVVLSLVFLSIYSLSIPLRPSVIRALIMIYVFSLTFISGYKIHPYASLGTAGLVSLFIFPEWAFDPGFHLSYLATYGIICFFPFIYSTLRTKYSRLNKFLIAPLGVSMSAQLTVFPYIVLVFGNLPLLSPLWNLVFFPLIFISISGAITAIILFPFSSYLSSRIASTSELSSQILLSMAEKISNITPFFKIEKNEVMYSFLLFTIPLILYILKTKAKIEKQR